MSAALVGRGDALRSASFAAAMASWGVPPEFEGNRLAARVPRIALLEAVEVNLASSRFDEEADGDLVLGVGLRVCSRTTV